MFEDSTFESEGRIRTRSRGWMFAAFAINSTILLALILIPLVYPEALPRMAMAFLMETPPPPPAASPAPPRQLPHSALAASNTTENPFTMPRTIPRTITILPGPEPTGLTNVASLDASAGVPGAISNSFGSQPAPRVIHPEVKGPAHLPSAIAAGLLLRKVIPQYPAIAKAMHVEGTVVLAATISKDGRIINLHVVSGPAVLQQAALDAVSSWRYRPYLLNGEPVDVETTINVIFTLMG
ncbi:MAG: energy transducer TonB [Terracidiphilus sp.]